MNWKSKIFWINVIGILIPIVALFADTYPKYAVAIGLGVNALTIILRQLQGKEVLGVRM